MFCRKLLTSFLKSISAVRTMTVWVCHTVHTKILRLTIVRLIIGTIYLSFSSHSIRKNKKKTSILYIKDMHTLYTRTLRVYMCTCTYMHMYKYIDTKYIYMLACMLSHLCIYTFIRLWRYSWKKYDRWLISV